MSERQMKGITVCAECVYYSFKRLKCNLGCADKRKPTDSFYLDCPLPDAEPVRHSHWINIWDENNPNVSTYGRCKKCNQVSKRPLGRYCRWCGAKMDEVNKCQK